MYKEMFLVLVLLLVLFSSICYAAPLLICDWVKQDSPNETLKAYVLVIDGGEEITVPTTKSSKYGVCLRYDLVNLPDGEHVIGVQAVNIFNLRSGIVEIIIDKKKPSEPEGLDIK